MPHTSAIMKQSMPIPVVPNQRLSATILCMRKRHVQQSLFRRGGKRRGAGRKPNGDRANQRHAARPDFESYHPLHIVMRVASAVGNLRRRKLYKAMRDATITAALREYFRIVHISLQRNHVHMLVEAEDKAALARGMQGFTISAARHINTALGHGEQRRHGKVFADRYHVEVITTPTQARHNLRYVRFNGPIFGSSSARESRAARGVAVSPRRQGEMKRGPRLAPGPSCTADGWAAVRTYCHRP
jgi:putative transposase